MDRIERINAGEVLLRVICDFFNTGLGLEKIRDPKNLSADEKTLLLKFINQIVGNNFEFNPRSFSRFLTEVNDGKYGNSIPSGNPSLCTLCYVALKSRDSKLKFRIRDKKKPGDVGHGQKFYATDFTRMFIDPMISAAALPRGFIDSCWYLYINDVEKDTQVRNTARKVLKTRLVDNVLNCEYFTTNDKYPDWNGSCRFDSARQELSMHFKTHKNEKRDLILKFSTNYSEGAVMIEGQITYTSMTDESTSVITTIYAVRQDCESELKLARFGNGEEKSIAAIEAKLREVTCQIIKTSNVHICHG